MQRLRRTCKLSHSSRDELLDNQFSSWSTLTPGIVRTDAPDVSDLAGSYYRAAATA
jgi:hypothetical protein